jgi:16S rRNA processing protein RimM
MRLLALSGNGTRRELRVQGFWPHKEWLVLKFEGIDSISDAETLLGSELQVPAIERAQLEEGWSYVSDLVGCTVWDGNHEIGPVTDVQFGTGEAPLLVVESGPRRFEIPFAEAYLKGGSRKAVDLKAKKIEMGLPDGLLEVNAPLTAEEKQHQRGGS